MSNIDNVVVFAARYAHNRNTGAALSVVNYIKGHSNELKKETIAEVIDESKFATTNKEDWESLEKWAQDNGHIQKIG